MIPQDIPTGAWVIGGILVGLAFYGLYDIIIKVAAKFLTKKNVKPD